MALLNKTINELLIDIERGRVALPDMQRELIWENAQIRDLVDSLYINHPIGMILLWQTNLDDNVPLLDRRRKIIVEAVNVYLKSLGVEEFL